MIHGWGASMLEGVSLGLVCSCIGYGDRLDIFDLVLAMYDAADIYVDLSFVFGHNYD